MMLMMDTRVQPLILKNTHLTQPQRVDTDILHTHTGTVTTFITILPIPASNLRAASVAVLWFS